MTKKFISPALNKVKELQKKKKGEKGYNPMIDNNPEGTKDLEDLDDWVKEITNEKI